MTDLLAQGAHRDFVSGVLFYYAQNDIVPGDPNEGKWDVCHYPLPKRLGGTETILMLQEHHAVQGVLQSEEYQCPCTSGFYSKYVKGTPYEDLQSKWVSCQIIRTINGAWERAWSNKDVWESWTKAIAEGTSREYQSRSESQKAEYREKHIYYDPRRMPVEIIYTDGTIEAYPSVRQALKNLSCSGATLRKILQGGTVSTQTFKARYV
jgi:hypothetical protein